MHTTPYQCRMAHTASTMVGMLISATFMRSFRLFILAGTSGSSVERFDRHRGLDRSSRTPATPPGMRVRTGRFVKLRLRGQSGDPQLVEVAIGKCHMKHSTRVHPPAATVHGHDHGCVLGHASGA